MFNQECDPVILFDDLSINQSMQMTWLYFISSEGLQNLLDKLYTYYGKWEMEVSTIKTKVMVFNTSGRLLRFHHNSINLEQVKEFNYLGTTFSVSGK